MENLENQVAHNSDEKTVEMLRVCVKQIIGLKDDLDNPKKKATRKDTIYFLKGFTQIKDNILERRGLTESLYDMGAETDEAFLGLLSDPRQVEEFLTKNKML